MKLLFRPAKKLRIFEDVVDQLEEAIIGGQAKVGERLPAERELRKILQTSRGTIRESLRVLETRGLIEIKLGKGGGAFIKAVSTDMLSENLDLLIQLQKLSLNDLAEFRERIEGRVAAIAAEKADDADIRILNDLLYKARGFVGRGSGHINRFLEVDKNLHLNLAKIVGNPLYVHILRTTHNVKSYFERFVKMGNLIMDANLKDLCAIVSAVSHHEPNKASAISMDHVQRFNEYKHPKEIVR